MTKNPQELLLDYVMRHYGRRLTAKQLREPWTYIGSRGGETSGVVIASDGDHPGFRVMLADLGLADMRAEPELDLQ